MSRGRSERTKSFLAILAIAIVIAMIGHVVSVVSYNSKEYRLNGAEQGEAVSINLGGREDSTSKWLKRDFDLNGKKVDITGETFDGVISNKAAHQVSDWKLRIDIKGDCFVNNAWCGKMEIHQHAGTREEIVQTLDLRDYDLKDVKLDYIYREDFLIPLTKGDYIIYQPSEKEKEVPLDSGTVITIGMIFYYLDEIDLSDYQLTYKYHRGYLEGKSFYAIAAMLVVWFAVLLSHLVAYVSYRRAWRDMEQRKTGISYMSDIYELIYMADMTNGELIPLKSDMKDPGRNRERESVPNRIKGLLLKDVAEEYQSAVQAFLDEGTLQERLMQKSLSCQYKGKTGSWYLIRLFAVEYDEDGIVRRLIFTLQNIDEEVAAMGVSQKKSAESEIPVISVRKEPYSIKEIVEMAKSDVIHTAGLKGVEVTTDLSREIPDLLMGDPGKLRMVVACMLLSALRNTSEGSIRLALYVRENQDGVAHLLLSIKDSGNGIPDDDEFRGLSLDMARETLHLMNSELHIIRDQGEGSELYFEVDQEIV